MFIKNYLKEILLVFNIILVLGLYFFPVYEMFFTSEKAEVIEKLDMSNEESVISEESNVPIIEEVVEPAEPTNKFQVEVKGEVSKPGVYSVVEDNIINDVIKMAGGFKQDAYHKNINLSKKVEDEMVIYVYSTGEYTTLFKEEVKYEDNICNCDDYYLDKCLESGSSVIIPENNESESSDQVEVKDNLVNINQASKEELMTLDGIGEAKAQKIIDYRNENGGFKSIEDIMQVSGISENLFEKIKANITV